MLYIYVSYSGGDVVVSLQAEGAPSTLKLRNVNIGAKRTSVKLEPQLWRALEVLAAAQNRTINDICQTLDATRGKGGLTSALRVYIVTELAMRAGLSV